MAIENINDYAGMWANGVNIGQMWDLIKAKFVSGAHDQTDATSYPNTWKVRARLNLGLPSLAAGQMWYAQGQDLLSVIDTTAMGRGLLNKGITKNAIWYGSDTNTIGEIITKQVGRDVLVTTGASAVANLWATKATTDSRDSVIINTYGTDLAFDGNTLKLKNNASTKAFIGTGIETNANSGLVRLTGGKIPLSVFPDAILGQLTFGGNISSYDSTDDGLVVSLTDSAKAILEERSGKSLTGKVIVLVATSTKPADAGQYVFFNYADCKGMYFIWKESALESHTGETVKYRIWPSGGPRYQAGDWMNSLESEWDKVDNTDAVTGVKGNAESVYRLGLVNITAQNVRALDTGLPNEIQNVQGKVEFEKDIWSLGGIAAYGVSDLSMGAGGGGGLSGSILRNWASYDPNDETQILGSNLGIESFRMTGAKFQFMRNKTWTDGFTLADSNIPDLPLTKITGVQSLTIKGGTTSIGTYSPSSALEVSIVAGTNISVTPDATNHKITIANTYSLPTASSSTKGGVKVGSGLTISNEVLSVSGVTNDMLSGSIANSKLASLGKFTIGSQAIELGQTYTQANFRTYLGLDTAATHAHGDYVTDVTWDSTNRKLKQSKGGGTATDIVTLGAAALKAVDTSITASSTSTDLPTSAAVASLVSGYLPLTGGTLSNYLQISASTNSAIRLVRTGNSDENHINFYYGDTNTLKAQVGYWASSAYLENSVSHKDLRLFDDGSITYDNNKVWHAGNDGSGSGLDADLLDGYHASQLYVRGEHRYGTENYIYDLVSGGQITRVDDDTLVTSGVQADTYFFVKTTENIEPGEIYTFGFYVEGFTGNENSWKFYCSNDATCIEISIKNGWVWGTGKVIPTSGTASSQILIDDRAGSSSSVVTFSKFILVKGYAFPAYLKAMRKQTIGYASSLATARTIWGQSFDGTANISGALTDVTTITASGQITSNVANGTAPLVIASKTLVTNLNADLLDGKHNGELTALNMKQEPKTNQEFVFRNSPKTIGADSLKLDRILGRTVVWNQLIANGDFSNGINSYTQARCSATASNHVCTITRTGTSDPYFEYRTDSAIPGHKYIQCFEARATQGAASAMFFVNNNQTIFSATITSSWARFIAVGNNTTNVTLRNRIQLATTDTVVVECRNFMIIDLTLMFGAGNEPSTVEEFEALYPNAYYEYNPGQLINNAAEGLETVGFNLWDEEWELGSLNYQNGDKGSSTTSIVTKNYIPVLPNTTYYRNVPASYGDNSSFCRGAFYDANFNYLGGPNGDSHAWINFDGQVTFTSPNNAYYMRFSVVKASYTNDICINISNSSKNGTYEPYKRNVLDLHLDNIQVKSPNIWDEEWENGAYNSNGAKSPDSSKIRSANFIPVNPNTSYYVRTAGQNMVVGFYDKNKQYLGTGSAAYYNNTTVISPTNAYYATFWMFTAYGTTYNNDICINESGWANGKYFPHGVLTFNGLDYVGSSRDEIVGGKLIKKTGKLLVDGVNVTIDSLYTESGLTRLSISKAQNTNIFKPMSYYKSDRFVDNHTSAATAYSITNTNSSILNRLWFWIPEETVSTVSQAIAWFANNNTNVVYELATPETYDLVAPIPTAMPAGTTERRLPEDTSDSVLAPFACDMTYGTNPGDILASGIAWEKIWGRPNLEKGSLSDALVSADTHNGEWFKLEMGGQILYVKFVVGEGAFKLQLADNDQNPTLSKEFEFATLSTADINAICV